MALSKSFLSRHAAPRAALEWLKRAEANGLAEIDDGLFNFSVRFQGTAARCPEPGVARIKLDRFTEIADGPGEFLFRLPRFPTLRQGLDIFRIPLNHHVEIGNRLVEVLCFKQGNAALIKILRDVRIAANGFTEVVDRPLGLFGIGQRETRLK